MKKTYIKPELFVEECIVEKIISTSGGDIGGTGSGGVINPEPAEPAANKHRGVWNDVWGDE
ncbi:MAG: hypothetical protein UH687_07440 [Bacteroidaceae bacterium]|jgi:hypothetical protein|nr:hypothetical protein [Bacteroidaceae bacterium]